MITTHDHEANERRLASPGSLGRSRRLLSLFIGAPSKLHHGTLGRNDSLRRHRCFVAQTRARVRRRRRLLAAERRQHGRRLFDRRLARGRRSPPSRRGQSRRRRNRRARSQARSTARCRTYSRFLIGYLRGWHAAAIKLSLNLCNMRVQCIRKFEKLQREFLSQIHLQ